MFKYKLVLSIDKYYLISDVYYLVNADGNYTFFTLAFYMWTVYMWSIRLHINNKLNSI